MLSDDITRICIKSADTYYKYLTDYNKGIQEIRVLAVEKKEDKYRLKLQKKPFSLDTLRFSIHGKRLLSDRVVVIGFDEVTKILTIRPVPQCASLFESINEDDITVDSDMRFLVKRTEEFYKNNGKKICFSRPAPTISTELVGDMPYKASKEQEEAIKTILTAPCSYVWGAPGTGKTRFVLAQAVLHYIRSGKTVAIFAPTNNALEQTLFGLMDVLKETDIPLNTVLRLGVPSQRFKAAYPECCEIQDQVQKLERLKQELKELTGQKEILQNGRDFVSQYEVLNDQIFPCFEKLIRLSEAYNKKISELARQVEKHNQNLETLIAANQSSVKQYEIQIGHIQKECEERAAAAERWRMMFFPQKKAELKKQNQDAAYRIEALGKEIFSLNNEIKDYMNSRQDFATLSKEIEPPPEAALMFSHLQNLSKLTFPEVSTLLNALNLGKAEIAKCELMKIRNGYMAEYYEYLSVVEKAPEDIDLEIANLTEQINVLQNQQSKNVRVIAATIDCFIGRYSPTSGSQDINRFCADHYFLDESAYCSLIKAATLFASGCPITFLGDHLQLPPVCELESRDIASIEKYHPVFLWDESALAIEPLFFSSYKEVFTRYTDKLPYVFSNIKKANLTETFRFGNTLSTVLDTFIYHNGLHSAPETNQFVLQVIHAPKFKGPKKRQNSAEAKAIAEWVNANQEEEYAVLTPYKNQVALIASELKGEEENVMTIHASQGREWDTVLFSVSDTHDMFFTNSLIFPRLLNTAVSRAKRRLILVCDTSYWDNQENQFITYLLHTAKTEI